MDWLKKASCKKFTRWDLNCQKVYKPRSHHKQEKIMIRSARHVAKIELQNDVKSGSPQI